MRDQIPVWTIEGYEGRFLKWERGLWQAFDYRNYRHWFSPPQTLTDDDIRALRDAFGVSEDLLPDSELVRASPIDLAELRSQTR
ncbi:MAG: hypothetical protein AAB403_09695 [Planctomycetota bacterium]